MAHRDLHPSFVDGCFGCKVLSVNVSATALENRGGAVRHADAKDRQLDRDLSSYKEMRDGGLQPKAIDGSSELVKRVSDQHDIDLGRIVPKDEKSRVQEGFAIAQDMGFTA